MPRRTRAQIQAEMERLDVILHFLINDWPAEHRDAVPSLADANALIASGAATPGQLLAGWRQAVNDFAVALRDGLRNGDQSAQRTIDAWRNQTGGDLLTDIGDPVRRAAAIAKAEKITNDTDWYLVKELVLSGDTPLTADVMARLDAMHAAYETAKGHA